MLTRSRVIHYTARFFVVAFFVCFTTILLSSNASALSVSWSSNVITFGEKPGLVTEEYIASTTASVTGATHGFTATIEDISDTCLKHQNTNTDCANTSANYKIPLTSSISPASSSLNTDTVIFTVKATTNSANVPGNYSGNIIVTILAITPPVCSGPTCATNYGNMQNFTSTQCSQMTNYDATIGEITYTNNTAYAPNNTLSGVNTVYLTDSRNSQQYRIRKMQDGNCWMIDNLKIYNATLTSTNSDIASGSFTLPSTLNTSANVFVTTTRVDDPSAVAYCVPNTGGIFAAFPNTTTGCGYLYSWQMATAGQGTDSSTGTIANSICPKNWNLPTGGANNQFATLGAAISLRAGGGQSWQGAYSGEYFNGFSGISSTGYYWTATSADIEDYAYGVDFTSSNISYNVTLHKPYGYAVRCIL